jgi:hypothetical protein
VTILPIMSTYRDRLPKTSAFASLFLTSLVIDCRT